MSAIEKVALALIGAHVVSCTLATRRLLASAFYEPVQKRIQIAIAWLIPALGVVLVWMFLCHERPGKPVMDETEDDDVQESLFAEHDSSNTPTPGAAGCGTGE